MRNSTSKGVKKSTEKATNEIKNKKRISEENKIKALNTVKLDAKKINITSHNKVKIANFENNIEVIRDESGKKSKKTSTKNRSKSKKRTTKINNSEITSYNTYLFHQGNNYQAYEIFGAHVRTENRKKGIQFSTWAPNAKNVYVVGDFSDFEINEKYKLNKISKNGIWKGFFTDMKVGDKYKYCIINDKGEKIPLKADPYALKNEIRPNTASIIYTPKNFRWADTRWIKHRNAINVLEQPLNIYEMHLGSWKRHKNGNFMTYEELSEELPKYLEEMNYTHVEFMPLAEHPLDASWGYQATCFYSPTSRYGDIEGLKMLINKLHGKKIGVIMDWAPGHFCKDSHGLYKFDGEPAYEYSEEWKAENKEWGTNSFDLGRPEVKSYLISNALYWFREFHIDGLRVDAVSSMLYLDYSKNDGEWAPNVYGDNGNLEGMQFLKDLNTAVFKEFPKALMIAEESTTWPNVTKPVVNDGLGFNLKWNMGWMNDILEYVELSPEYREYHHKNINFAMMYNYSENYILPLSHDEVVHGKKSIVQKMWGDEWNKFAGFRTLIAYMMGHPGKKLMFMGGEFAQDIEWREYEELKWELVNSNKYNKKTQLFVKDVNKFYLENRALWQLDYSEDGFEWIEANNNKQSILVFARKSVKKEETLIFLVNFKPDVYYDYRIGVPLYAEYEEALNSDSEMYGGSGQIIDEILKAEKQPFHGQDYSIKIKVPPMATLVLKIKKILKDEVNSKETL